MEVLAGSLKDGANVPGSEALLEGATPSAIANGGGFVAAQLGRLR